MPCKRLCHATVTLDNSKFLLFGGYKESDNYG